MQLLSWARNYEQRAGRGWGGTWGNGGGCLGFLSSEDGRGTPQSGNYYWLAVASVAVERSGGTEIWNTQSKRVA